MKKQGKKKVFVGMSGGVDSSVSAALLQQQGYDVTGVFIKVWQADWMPCTWKQERQDAMRVAAQLGIPFLTCDAEEEYKKEVVDYMIAEYSAGRTPNPDVMCNKYVKFGTFLKFAEGHGAEYVATGHYAKRVETKDEEVEMHISTDTEKDQTYFLWTLPQESLAKVLFPVGNFKKEEVRTLAKKFNLPNFDKKDSQGLCFIGKVYMKEFLKHYISEKKGEVLDENGKVIGSHDGAYFYTLGERHGFSISHKTPDDLPYYVMGKDIIKNTITVTTHESKNPETVNEFALEQVNWMSGNKPAEGMKLFARFRYRQPLRSCVIKNVTSSSCAVLFDEPQEYVAAGQSIVFYFENNCVGGGVIK